MNNQRVVQQKFSAALDKSIEQVKSDRSILAAILCGSLSHDTVWDKSDIDLLLVTVDDRKIEEAGLSLVENDINIHAFLIPRATFKKTVEGAVHNSFMHSLLAKGRLLYTRDPTLADLCDTATPRYRERLNRIGERDMKAQLLRAGISAIPLLYKAQKWFHIRQDLDYAALWLLYAATPLAQIEVFSRRLLADREIIPMAMALNPTFLKLVYADLFNKKRTVESIQKALAAVEAYLENKIELLFAPSLNYFQEAGEVRSASDIEHYFEKQMNVSCVTTACEYLADKRLISKAASPVKLTKLSNIEVQELAFFYMGEPPDDF